MEDINNIVLRSDRHAGAISGNFHDAGQSLYSRHFKRVFDSAVVLAALPVVLPIVLLLAAAIFLTERQNPFFSHKRVGRDGRIFGCLKLRTMVAGAETMLPKLLEGSPDKQEEWAESQKLTDDPRVTRLGAILRKTSLDELPQLLNVLRGDMSLVGPRPIVMDELRRYGQDAATYLRLRPGLTGMWQTTGRNDVSYAERIRMDVEYEQNVMLWTDIRIMAMTVVAMLQKTGR
ncbi:sugar transferase [Paracoccus sp. YIM 132242]|uniref:Sugar transferase n=1 Tax=Paracoccus lichenicola TaxID=2665644 RepID=A0A6L6HRC3_9RHOB|nr:sugar transferase [Paracoccus lichenicola]MTD99827.1 sugar transferase [Paracoccus lichenicola]